MLQQVGRSNCTGFIFSVCFSSVFLHQVLAIKNNLPVYSWAFLIKTAKTPRSGKFPKKEVFFLPKKEKNSPIGIYVFQKIEFRKKPGNSAISKLVERISRKKTRDFTEKKIFLPSNFKKYTQFSLLAVLFHYNLMVNTLQP